MVVLTFKCGAWPPHITETSVKLTTCPVCGRAVLLTKSSANTKKAK